MPSATRRTPTYKLAGGDPAAPHRPDRFSTATVAHDGHVVPWLAADGPLAYSPEKPPERDYYFQYGWVLPGIFADHTNTRRHFYFGASVKEDTRKLFDFWKAARNGVVERVAYQAGVIDKEAVSAPVAVYRAAPDWHGPAYLLMQHGSYQIVPAADQPLLEASEVILYRGVQQAAEFRFPRLGTRDSARRQAWQRYVEVHVYVLSDATRSFNSIHDRAVRSETTHIRDRSRMTDEIARRHGLDIDGDGFNGMLWAAAHQSFALARWVAEHKFGPNFVVCKTALGNVRLTTFFAGEHEVRVIDPDEVEVLEEHGCKACR